MLFQDCDRSAKKITWREIVNFTKRELEALNQFCSLLSMSLLSGGKVLTKKEVKGIGNLLWRRGGRLGEGEGERSFSKHNPILIISQSLRGYFCQEPSVEELRHEEHY